MRGQRRRAAFAQGGMSVEEGGLSVAPAQAGVQGGVPVFPGPASEASSPGFRLQKAPEPGSNVAGTPFNSGRRERSRGERAKRGVRSARRPPWGRAQSSPPFRNIAPCPKGRSQAGTGTVSAERSEAKLKGAVPAPAVGAGVAPRAAVSHRRAAGARGTNGGAQRAAAWTGWKQEAMAGSPRCGAGSSTPFNSGRRGKSRGQGRRAAFVPGRMSVEEGGRG